MPSGTPYGTRMTMHRGPEGGQNPQNELSFMNFNCLFFESAIPGELKTL